MSRVDLIVKHRAQDLDVERVLQPAPPVALVRILLHGWHFADISPHWLHRLGIQTIRVKDGLL